MTTLDTILACLFWCCVGGVVYAYALYPVVIFLLSRVCGTHATPPHQGKTWPQVDLLIAAHNEADVVESRIRNALALDYPQGRLRLTVASDGSDDGTVAVCRRFEPSIQVLEFPDRQGKTQTLNAALPHLTGDIVVLSDANTFMDKDALKNLLRWFQDPSVGVVCGRLVLTDPHTGKNVDGAYWKYETFLKQCESRLGALLGANGAIYAIRRSLLTPLPGNILVDDFVIPLAATLKSRCRLLYDKDAIAHEESAPDVSSEFRRRARIGAGGFQALGLLWPLLNPARGWIAFSFWSHKVLRWIGPLLLIGALAAAAALWEFPLYRQLFQVQVAFYAAAALLAVVPGTTNATRLLRLCPMFVSMNLALLLGLWRCILGNQTGIWRTTPRSQSQTAAGTSAASLPVARLSQPVTSTRPSA
jgi:cellulose synthase/poly-beta-1,6-N-acetylglucosamine synthase-like glycosyltransferase